MLENWSAAQELLLRRFPSAARGSHDEIRLTLHGQPLLVWLGVSSRHDSPDVAHLAAPILSAAGSGSGAGEATGTATPVNSHDTPADSSRTASAPRNRASDYETVAHLLAQFGIDPDGPDIVELARAAEKLPLGGLRLLGGSPHLHNAVEFPIEEDWLASAAELVAAEAAALGRDDDEATRGRDGNEAARGHERDEEAPRQEEADDVR